MALLTQIAGTWAAGTEAAPPAGAGTNPRVSLGSVSCASAGNCTTVGGYVDSSGNLQGLLLTQTAATWAAGVQAAPPAGAGTSPQVSLSSVSCTSAGNCTTVGSYADGSGNLQGLLLTQTTGTQAAGVQAPLPADAASNPFAFPASLSCASAGNRTAVGQYTDSSGSTQGLLLTQTTPTCSGSGLTIAKKAPSQTGHPARPGVGPSQSPRRTAPAAICTPRRSRAAPPGGYRTPLQPQPGHGTVSIKPGNGSQTVTWTGFTLASGASASITVTVSGTVPKGATCGSSLPISGSWSATGLDASNTEVSSGHSTPGTIQVTC